MRELARAHDPALTALADQGFSLFRRATENAAFMGKWEFWEAIMALNLQQAENTAAAAWELAYVGYYVQAGALARLVTEYLAVVWYLPNHQDEADKWNDVSVPPPGAGDLLKKVFAGDPKVDAEFAHLRKEILHRYAHQDSRGLRVVLGESEGPGHLTINARGMFDPPQFEYTARVLLPLHASVPMAMNKWRGDRDPDWQRDAVAYRDAVDEWVDTYDKRAASGEEPGVSA